MDFTNKTALITGASTGIGAVFARELAAKGANLVLVARSQDKLEALAGELRAKCAGDIHVMPSDLSQPGAIETLVEKALSAGLTIDVLINNAGFGTHGDVSAADPARLVEEVQLNCVAVVELTARLLPSMTSRRSGVILNVASTAAFQPLAHMAVYGATKAFVLSFTEALWAEVKPYGVSVLALCPGATETPFFDVVGTDDASVGRRRTPEQVVQTAFKALDRGRPSIVDGGFNALLSKVTRLLPRRAVIVVAERSMRPSKT